MDGMHLLEQLLNEILELWKPLLISGALLLVLYGRYRWGKRRRRR